MSEVLYLRVSEPLKADIDALAKEMGWTKNGAANILLAMGLDFLDNERKKDKSFIFRYLRTLAITKGITNGQKTKGLPSGGATEKRTSSRTRVQHKGDGAERKGSATGGS